MGKLAEIGRKVEGQIKIVADDLTVTNTKLWQEAMEKRRRQQF